MHIHIHIPTHTSLQWDNIPIVGTINGKYHKQYMYTYTHIPIFTDKTINQMNRKVNCLLQHYTIKSNNSSIQTGYHLTHNLMLLTYYEMLLFFCLYLRCVCVRHYVLVNRDSHVDRISSDQNWLRLLVPEVQSFRSSHSLQWKENMAIKEISQGKQEKYWKM